MCWFVTIAPRRDGMLVIYYRFELNLPRVVKVLWHHVKREEVACVSA